VGVELLLDVVGGGRFLDVQMEIEIWLGVVSGFTFVSTHEKLHQMVLPYLTI